MADLIDRQAAIKLLRGKCVAKYPSSFYFGLFVAADEIDKLPAVDAVEVVRCAQCEHGIWDEEEGLWMCVFTADYDEELGVYHGFIQHNTADYYCADGKRRKENGSD